MDWHFKFAEVVHVHLGSVCLPLSQFLERSFERLRVLTCPVPVDFDDAHDHAPLVKVSCVEAVDEGVEDLSHCEVAEQLIAIINSSQLVLFNQALPLLGTVL